MWSWISWHHRQSFRSLVRQLVWLSLSLLYWIRSANFSDTSSAEIQEHYCHFTWFITRQQNSKVVWFVEIGYISHHFKATEYGLGRVDILYLYWLIVPFNYESNCIENTEVQDFCCKGANFKLRFHSHHLIVALSTDQVRDADACQVWNSLCYKMSELSNSKLIGANNIDKWRKY